MLLKEIFVPSETNSNLKIDVFEITLVKITHTCGFSIALMIIKLKSTFDIYSTDILCSIRLFDLFEMRIFLPNKIEVDTSRRQFVTGNYLLQ